MGIISGTVDGIASFGADVAGIGKRGKRVWYSAGGGNEPVFNPLNLFGPGDVGVWYDFTTPDHIKQNSDGTGAVIALDDPIGWVEDLVGGGYHATQSTSAARPLWKEGYAKFDLLDDFIQANWPTIPIGTIAIVTMRGVFFDNQYSTSGLFEFARLSAPRFDTDPHTYYTNGIAGMTDAISSGDNNLRMLGLFVIDRVLSAEEMQQFEDYYLPLNCPGRIAISSTNYLVNPSFDAIPNNAGWTRSSFVPGVCDATYDGNNVRVSNTSVSYGGQVYQTMADVTSTRSFLLQAVSRYITNTGTFCRIRLYRQPSFASSFSVEVTSTVFTTQRIAARSIYNNGFRAGVSAFRGSGFPSAMIECNDIRLFPITFPPGFEHE